MSARAFPPQINYVVPAPRATTGHMPFSGHRTVATAWSEEKTYRRAMEYGFEPESLKAKQG